MDQAPYDTIADLYDSWTAEYRSDIEFYVSVAEQAGGPVVELGVGTGRIAVPTARRGVAVIGVDSSPGMLDRCRRRAQSAGVGALLDLRLGDFRRPPVDEQVRLVTCPYRAFGHLDDDDARREALTAVHALLVPDGRFAFDVFTPLDPDLDIHAVDWVERAPGIWERDRWDLTGSRMTVSVRSGDDVVDLRFALPSRERWRQLLEETGFEVFACYGWFDRSPCATGGTAVWVARRSG